MTKHKSTAANFYRGRLDNPLTNFLSQIPRGLALEQLLTDKLYPKPDDEVRKFPLNERLRLVVAVREIHVPLGRDIELNEFILDMLEQSYASRRPTPRLVAEREKIVRDLADAVDGGAKPQTEASGCALIGIPGTGKTRTLNRILANIPQVVEHDVIAHPLLLPKMITHLRLECPSNRKISALLENIVAALEAALNEKLPELKKGNISIRLQHIALACLELNVGVLIVDEIQHVLRKCLEPDLELTNFLVEFSNRLGIPLLLVGTPQAEYVVAGAMRQARRMTGPHWDNFARESRSWKRFSDTLLQYQFTGKIAEVEELEETLYDLSQGLPAIAVVLFQFAQRSALLLESETGVPTKVSIGMLQAVSLRYMRVVAPMLDALRSGNAANLVLYPDLKSDPEEIKRALMNEVEDHRERTFFKLISTARSAEKKAILAIRKGTMALAAELKPLPNSGTIANSIRGKTVTAAAGG